MLSEDENPLVDKKDSSPSGPTTTIIIPPISLKPTTTAAPVTTTTTTAPTTTTTAAPVTTTTTAPTTTTTAAPAITTQIPPSLVPALSSSKTLIIYFNGGALKFEPSMLIPNTKGKDVFFNPTIKYNPKTVYYIPNGQNKQYRYNKFFSSIAFNDQIVGATLRSIGGKQKLMTLEEATNARVIDYNIYVTLHALFSTNNVLYINKKPYTIYKFTWNEEWQLDTKLTSSMLRTNNPYASESFIRYEKEEEEEAKKMLEEVPEAARMSVKMKENILKSEAAVTGAPVAKPSIKTVAARTTLGTRQNLVNVFTNATLNNAYKSPYYEIIAAEHKKNPITIIRPFPDHLKIKEKETNTLARAAASSAQSDVSSEFITFTIMRKLTGLSFDDIISRTFTGEEQSKMIKNKVAVAGITDTLFRTLNKFYDAHHPIMSGKLNEIMALIEPLQESMRTAKKPGDEIKKGHLKAPDEAYFWKWVSDIKNQQPGSGAGFTTFVSEQGDLEKMKRMAELREQIKQIEGSQEFFKQPETLKQYFDKIEQINNLFNDTSESFRTSVKDLYDKIFPQFMNSPSSGTEPINMNHFNQLNLPQLQLLGQFTLLLNDFVKLLCNCVDTIRGYVFTLKTYFMKTKEILVSFSEKIRNDGFLKKRADEDTAVNQILLIACEQEIKMCDAMVDKCTKMLPESVFYKNVYFLQYAASDPLLSANLFIKYSNPRGPGMMIDTDFRTLFKYIFEAHIFVTGVSKTTFETCDNASEIAHSEIKQHFVKVKNGYANASTDYEIRFAADVRDAYESSLTPGGNAAAEMLRRQNAVSESNPDLIEAYQRKKASAKQMRTIIIVHPHLSYVHCLRSIEIRNAEREEAAWKLSQNVVSKETNVIFADGSLHDASMFPLTTHDEIDNDNQKYSAIMQNFNINNLRKQCSAIMNQTLANSCEELQLHVVNPFADCLPNHRYKKGEGDLARFYKFVGGSNHDDPLLQIVCDVLNAHLKSIDASSTHPFFNTESNTFQPENIKKMNMINLQGDLLKNMLIGLKINLITIVKYGDIETVLHYVTTDSSDHLNIRAESGIAIGSINFSDYIILFKPDEKMEYSVYIPVGGNSAIISIEDMRANYKNLMTDNVGLTQDDINKLFVPMENPVMKGGAVTSTPATGVRTPAPNARRSLSSQIAAAKNIQKMANKESKLSYYVMVDLVLVPGDKISIMQMANMECKIKADNVQKSLSETFGFAYAPPPLFTDYETERHDNHGARKNPFAVDRNDVSNLIGQHEKELNAVLSDSYKKEQDLAMERAMQQLGKSYPTKRGFFS